MNRMIVLAALGMVAGGCASVATAAVPASARQLCKRVQQTSRAWATKDYPAIERWIGPGFVHIDDMGRLMRKKQWLAWVSKRVGFKQGVITKNILIRTLDSTAVVTYEDYLWSKKRGFSKSAEHLIMTTVWHRYGGQWKEVSYQTSVLFNGFHCKAGRQVRCKVQVTGPAPKVDGHALPDQVPYVRVGACRYEDISG